ncbi:glycosyl transferase [Rickenella mellea]|uniref:Glycosyl transferase n=1 Tax=Rickenella mellea TaxID=50990 RepID=A0A4Y7Q8A1_9AGAM|nr:glycosyl transferase [Rickenella mellea]
MLKWRPLGFGFTLFVVISLVLLFYRAEDDEITAPLLKTLDIIPSVLSDAEILNVDWDDLDYPQSASHAEATHSRPEKNLDPITGRANATLLMLTRNSDLDEAVKSIESLERTFNHAHNYPWIFLNEEPFTATFKKRVATLTNASVQFGIIPREHWFQPDWIDEEKARQGRIRLQQFRGAYAESVSYRNMCRFYSGFFFWHELLQPYKWYWRVEPGVQFFCHLDFDPFAYMMENKKRYSFTLSMKEGPRTIPSLWSTVRSFTSLHPQYLARSNAHKFISEDKGHNYNLCHFWSNFEIADLDFFRSPAYTAFFSYLDGTGNFYYERWGDAPVHSIAASLFLPKDQIHFFGDIGYRHYPFQHCPQGDSWTRGKCECDVENNFDYQGDSCTGKFQALFDEIV